ncbi:hypothetical protein LWI29_016065 [Acer saccharum]|uniref:K-box domain-containing protein n=1 Tax=Acer saccharum TaxID=4024 RepID=A0AA39SCF7_ACESA|nr:hypothetical protein LWI29_016065 [Acer saccharum]
MALLRKSYYLFGWCCKVGYHLIFSLSMQLIDQALEKGVKVAVCSTSNEKAVCIISYAAKEDFLNADAVFDCIGDFPEERFDLSFCGSLLQTQHYMGEELDSLSLTELQSLEQQLGYALKHITNFKG